jgi:hopanoid-associated phosphorylase
MASETPLLLVVTGLQREAQIAAGDGVATLCSGGNPELLRARLASLFSARPRESGDPEPTTLDSRFRDNNRMEVGIPTRQDRNPRGILSFGLAGGLAPDLRAGDVILATHVAAGREHYHVSLDWQDEIAARLAGTVRLRRGAIAGIDKVLAKAADKAALHAFSGALTVDMESHIAADYAHQRRLPFAALRAVSDPATRSLPAIASDALTAEGNVDLRKVIGGLLHRPGQLPALIAAGFDSERAFASLRRCRGLLGPLFGLRGPDLR